MDNGSEADFLKFVGILSEKKFERGSSVKKIEMGRRKSGRGSVGYRKWVGN